jgi:hypothetical protein
MWKIVGARFPEHGLRQVILLADRIPINYLEQRKAKDSAGNLEHSRDRFYEQ